MPEPVDSGALDKQGGAAEVVAEEPEETPKLKERRERRERREKREEKLLKNVKKTTKVRYNALCDIYDYVPSAMEINNLFIYI